MTNPAPVLTAQDKWQLLPAFLKVKGLVKQHLDSFNHFVKVDMKAIINANARIVADGSPQHWIKYTSIRVEPPWLDSGAGKRRLITPMECRLTDSTYSGRILVDVEWPQDNGQLNRMRNLCIGYLPIMLRSDLCHLRGKGEEAMARMGECSLDPGGYFVVKGTEKVILVQEQLSKNRIIVMRDKKDEFLAEVTS